jgi:hypothetical protein
MTLMRIRCPVCGGVSEATASQTRCGQCGRLFGSPAAIDSAAAPESRSSSPGRAGWIPPPPSVIYLTSGSRGPRASAPTPGTPPAPDRPELGFANAEPSGDTTESRPDKPADAEAPATTPSPVSHSPVSLGPPPPYRPIVAGHRPAPTRAEMAPVPASAAPVNIRVLGALGPPPPYRPIVQAGAVFERGPPPDLEPWRLASPTRNPAPGPAVQTEPEATGADPADAEWSLIREAEPKVVATPELDPTIRLEGRQDFEPIYGPVVWPAEIEASFGAPAQGLPQRPRRRAIRPLLWASGIVMAVIVLGAVLGIGRGSVMRTFPGTVRIYAAIGLAASASAKCDQRGQPGGVVPPDSQDDRCGNRQSAVIAK